MHGRAGLCKLGSGAKPADVLTFELSSDIEHIVITTDATKKVMPLASAIFHIMKQRNIPDVGVKFHKLSPLMHMVEVSSFEARVPLLERQLVCGRQFHCFVCSTLTLQGRREGSLQPVRGAAGDVCGKVRADEVE